MSSISKLVRYYKVKNRWVVYWFSIFLFTTSAIPLFSYVSSLAATVVILLLIENFRIEFDIFSISNDTSNSKNIYKMLPLNKNDFKIAFLIHAALLIGLFFTIIVFVTAFSNPSVDTQLGIYGSIIAQVFFLILYACISCFKNLTESNLIGFSGWTLVILVMFSTAWANSPNINFIRNLGGEVFLIVIVFCLLVFNVLFEKYLKYLHRKNEMSINLKSSKKIFNLTKLAKIRYTQSQKNKKNMDFNTIMGFGLYFGILVSIQNNIENVFFNFVAMIGIFQIVIFIIETFTLTNIYSEKTLLRMLPVSKKSIFIATQLDVFKKIIMGLLLWLVILFGLNAFKLVDSQILNINTLSVFLSILITFLTMGFSSYFFFKEDKFNVGISIFIYLFILLFLFQSVYEFIMVNTYWLILIAFISSLGGLLFFRKSYNKNMMSKQIE